MNKKKMIKLAKFLEGLEPAKFNFSQVVEKYDKDKECGTICCALGWMPAVFPKEVQWTSRCTNDVDGWRGALMNPDGESHYLEIAAAVLDISADNVACLFLPHQQELIHKDLDRCGAIATPKDVAKMLRQFVELVGKGRIDERGNGMVNWRSDR